MKTTILKLALITLPVIVCAQSSNSTLDAYVNSQSSNVFDEIAGSAQLISKPNDLDFNPDQTNGFPALWVINEGTENSGGSTVTILNPGESNQSSVFKKDGNSWHFMSLPTGLAFGDDGTWANSPGVFDANHNGGAPFTGPALWASDFSVYAITPPGGNGSHLDMLHESPLSMGIAHEKDNIYWVNDGYNSNIAMYDFGLDHGPGQSYHGDGRIHVYSEVSVKRDATGIPGHVILDKNSKWLYICDTGNSRILRMKVRTGSKKSDMTPYEPVQEKWEMQNVTWEVVATGLSKPCGVDVFGDRLIVTDNGTNEIIIYDISSTTTVTEVGRLTVPHSNPNIRGVKVDYKGNIWFVDYTNNNVFRLSNENVVGIDKYTEYEKQFSIYPNPVMNELYLQFNNKQSVSKLSVVDTQGKKVLISFNPGDRLNVGNLNSGLYFILVESKDGSIQTRKFQKN